MLLPLEIVDSPEEEGVQSFHQLNDTGLFGSFFCM
jgi:hypothetical protein